MLCYDLFSSDFGLATLKIWQNVMNMRGESKGVVDALTQVIMTGWDLSPSVRPILTINYVVRTQLKSIIPVLCRSLHS